jgi:hypothetical protein
MRIQREKSMRTRSVVVVLGLALLASTACDGALVFARMPRAEGTFERALNVTGQVDLDVSTGSGQIVIRRQVRIEGRVSASEGRTFGRSSLTADERVRRVTDAPPIEQNGNAIRIGRIDDEDLRNVSISYTITVPPATSLTSQTGSGSQEIEGIDGAVIVRAGSGAIRVRDAGSDVRASTGSGDITIEGVRGDFSGRAGSGSIEATSIAGAVTVHTGSGRIRVAQTGTGDVEASAGSGSIDLSGVRARVRASAASGSLTISGEHTAEWRLSTASGHVDVQLDGRPAFDLDARGGRIDTRYPLTVNQMSDRRELRGSVNGGGPLLSVRTSSGRISIR